MKTKRTLLTIIVFLSVFWIPISIVTDIFIRKKPDEQTNGNPPVLAESNSQPQTTTEARYKSQASKYDYIASISDKIYSYEELGTDSITDTDTNTNLDLDLDTDSDTDLDTDTDTNIISNANTNADSDDDSNSDVGLNLQTDNYTHDAELTHRSLTLAKLSVSHSFSDESSAYSDIGISIAKSYVNIRNEATTEGEIRGKLYRNSAARILDTVGDWFYIESGSVIGYVAKEYIKTNIPDDELIEEYGTLRASINTEGLNVREHADTQSDKLTVVYKNEIYPVIDLYEDWLKVDISDDNIIGYVNREYVELLVDFEKAVSKEEEEELNKLQEEERIKKEKLQEEERVKNEKLQEEGRIKKETEVKYREEWDSTKDELKLLACLVHAEAGDQSYEGKLAVANVVLNRVKSSKYPNTIKDVIYQPGQFTVANSGSLAKQLDKYESYSSKSQLLTVKAAKAALNGANNIGNRLYFNAYNSAVSKGYDQNKNSVKIEDHLFW